MPRCCKLHHSTGCAVAKSLVNEKNLLHNVNVFNFFTYFAIINSNIRFLNIYIFLANCVIRGNFGAIRANSKINVSLMWARVRIIFTVPNQFYLQKKF